jgi:hypothetical protein
MIGGSSRLLLFQARYKRGALETLEKTTKAPPFGAALSVFQRSICSPGRPKGARGKARRATVGPGYRGFGHGLSVLALLAYRLNGFGHYTSPPATHFFSK